MRGTRGVGGYKIGPWSYDLAMTLQVPDNLIDIYISDHADNSHDHYWDYAASSHEHDHDHGLDYAGSLHFH